MFRVVFHPKQLMVISGGDDGDVRIWDLVTKTCTATLKVHCDVLLIPCPADLIRQRTNGWCGGEQRGHRDLAGCHTAQACCGTGWRALQCAAALNCTWQCNLGYVAAGSNSVFSVHACGASGESHDMRASTDFARTQGHFSAVTDLALAPGNWSLLSAARDSVVIMWDLRSFAKLATFPIYEVLEGVRTHLARC